MRATPLQSGPLSMQLVRSQPLSELGERLTHVLERFPRDELLVHDSGDAEDASLDDCSALVDAVAAERECKVALVQDR
jgi:hypothetical protein